jgi:chromosomal replication initiator protein
MKSPFTPAYTFSSFIVAPYNEMAFEAAQAIVEEIGTRYNPFFLSGGFWSGKTHLLHAIGNAVQSKNGNYTSSRVFYVDGKVFAEDIALALKKRKLTALYKYYSPALCDILMIDGFQALEYDDIAQNVAMRIVNALQKETKQVVITSTRPVHRFPVVEEYFRSEFATGLISEILAPEAFVKHRDMLWE